MKNLINIYKLFGLTVNLIASVGVSDVQGLNLNTRHVLERDRLKHISGISIDDDDVLVKSGSLGDEIHSSLSLLLLKLQGNTSDGTSGNALHQVGDETSDLVAHPLGWDDGNL